MRKVASLSAEQNLGLIEGKAANSPDLHKEKE